MRERERLCVCVFGKRERGKKVRERERRGGVSWESSFIRSQCEGVIFPQKKIREKSKYT